MHDAFVSFDTFTDANEKHHVMNSPHRNRSSTMQAFSSNLVEWNCIVADRESSSVEIR